MENKISVDDFVQELNYMLSGAEPQSDDVLAELMHSYSAMFLVNCGMVPNFEIINSKGQIKLIRPEF